MVEFILTCFLLFSASGVEEQRKYNFSNDFQIPKNEFEIDSFKFTPHSLYKTDDIYFDTAEQSLRTQGYSFRLRRVEKKAGEFEYSVQLKSEMTSLNEIRQELEHKDLLTQKVDGQLLTPLIDQFIEKENRRTAIAPLLSAWMLRKSTSSLAPFQKLRGLKISLTTIRPLVLGHSDRQRYYVSTKSTTVKNSKKNEFYIPEYFKNGKKGIWLMDASFDQSNFFDLVSQKKFALSELEIENKYRPRKVGTQQFNTLEALLIQKWQVKTGMASKYLQAVQHFEKD